jgi:hypothetical protein
VLFEILTPCGSLVRNNILDQHVASVFYSEDEGDMLLRNYGNHLQDYIA